MSFHHHPEIGDLLGRWTADPLVVSSLLVSSAAYAAGLARLWRHAGRGHGIAVREALAFAAGIVSLVVALVSPLEAVSDVLFSAHMSQHAMLMLVSAPLLVLGRPLLAFLWLFGRGGREAVARALRAPAAARVWRVVSAPFIVLVLQALALWIWHVPALFDAALADDGIHALQHLSFFLTAALFWWSLIHGRYGRAGYGVSVGYVFVTALHSSILGAMAGLAGQPWYRGHIERTRAYGLAPDRDQQLAGILMWVPAGVLLLVLALALFAAWLGEAGRQARRAAAARERSELVP